MVGSRARAAGALACATLALAGCGTDEAPTPVTVTSTSYIPPAQAPAPPPAAPPAPPSPVDATDAQSLLDATVADTVASFGGQLGAATLAEAGPIAAGFTDASPAWSTIKVPIAVATMRTHPELADSVRAAITLSDNNAAELMFATVGPEPVDTVLAEAGLDAAVNTVKVRPEFSTFGQTALGVADEAALADHLACLAGAADVLSLMGQVDASQAYGLGSVGALFKGGWGPDAAGMYQVRQLGLMPRGDGTFAPVALTALPADGLYATGQAMLNAAAQQLAANAAALPAASCQP